MGRSSYLEPAPIRFLFSRMGDSFPTNHPQAPPPRAVRFAPESGGFLSPHLPPRPRTRKRRFFRFLWAVFGQEGFFLLEFFHAPNRRQSLWNKGKTRLKFVFFRNPLSGFRIPTSDMETLMKQGMYAPRNRSFRMFSTFGGNMGKFRVCPDPRNSNTRKPLPAGW
jgi:hypothetical protein